MTLPLPRTPEELKVTISEMRKLPLNEQLEFVLRTTEHLRQVAGKTYGVKDLPPLALEGLSFEEKLVLGRQQSARLKVLAKNVRQLQAMDSLEQDLATDTSSEQVLGNLMKRMRK